MSNSTTAAYQIWWLIAALTTAGWTKVMDSDGTSYSASGTQVTGPNTGTNGLDNSRAWVRMQAPAVNGGSVVNQKREFTFQRGSSASTDWRIKYSASALFTGGSPAATVTPSSTDEVFMCGGGTDASPTFYTWLYDPLTQGATHFHCVAGGAAEFYSFAMWQTGTTNAALAVNNQGFFLDVMATGSYSVLDVDPAVVFLSTTGNTGISQVHTTLPATTVTNPALARAWLGATSAAGASVTSNNVGVGSFTYSPFNNATTFGTNPWTNKDDMYPIYWGSSITIGPRGIKGISTLFKAGTVQRGQMVIGETSSGAKDKVFIDRYWAPWNGTGTLI